METPNFFFFFKKVQNLILSVPRLSLRREKKSPWLCWYQPYISNWYINGKVFTSTTTWETKNWFFLQKSLKLNLTCAEELKWTFKLVATSDVKKKVFFISCFFREKKKVFFFKKNLFYCFFFCVFLKYGININTQVETTLLWDLFSIYDTVSNYFTSLLLI